MTFFTSLFIAFCTSLLSEVAGWYLVTGTEQFKTYQSRIKSLSAQKKKSKVTDKDIKFYTMKCSQMQFKSLIFTSIILFFGYSFINGHVIELPFKVPLSYLQRN